MRLTDMCAFASPPLAFFPFREREREHGRGREREAETDTKRACLSRGPLEADGSIAQTLASNCRRHFGCHGTMQRDTATQSLIPCLVGAQRRLSVSGTRRHGLDHVRRLGRLFGKQRSLGSCCAPHL